MSIRLLLLLLCILFGSGAQSGTITLLADPPQAYQSFSIQLEETLSSLPLSDSTPNLLITIGPKSLTNALQQSIPTPLLALLVTHDEFDQALQQAPSLKHPATAIFREQPLHRLIQLSALALPSIHHVGILQSGEEENIEILTQQGLQITQQTTQQLHPSLRQLLSNTNALITHHDPALFNAQSFRGILLSAYRQQKPLICHTTSAVQAGCVVGASTSSEEMIAQTQTWISQFSRGGQGNTALFSPQYPAQFTVVTNPKVARSLGIHLDHPSTLTQQLQQFEETLQ